MRSLVVAGGVVVALHALLACGPSARERARREAQPFECRDRYATYHTSHHLSGDEIGVQMDCASAGPRIVRWRTSKAGNRLEDARSLPPAEFDRIWNQIDGIGWPFLKDCTNGTDGANDPVYLFEIKDDQNQSSFSCQSTTMPYPYNSIVDPLDLAAQFGRKQLGDDEPEDLKQLEKKKPAP
jgi:hypothetical protein